MEAFVAATTLEATSQVRSAFFVAPNGDDERGNGTWDHPFATVQRAILASLENGLDGGDDIFLRAGTYHPEKTITLSEKGNPQRWSRLRAWQNEHVVIDGSQIPPTDGEPSPTIRVTGRYYEISGLELVSAPKSSISLYGTHVRIIGNVIRDSVWGAVWSEPGQSGSLLFAQNVVYHNCLMNRYRQLTGGWPSAVNLTSYDDTVVNNRIYENYGEGIGAYGSGHYIGGNDLHDNFGAEIYLNNATDTVVEANFIHSDGNEAFFRDWNLKDEPVIGPGSFPFWAPSEGINMANESSSDLQFARNRVVNNIVIGPHYRALNWWNGESSEGSPPNGGLIDSLIAHNTVVSDAEALFHLDDNDHCGTQIRDNLFYQLRPDRPLTDFHGVHGITFSHNLRFGGEGSGPAGEGRGPGDIEEDPRLVNPQGEKVPHFRLRSESPAIDAGIPVNLHLDYFGNERPYGDGYDIGAHEWTKTAES